ncbi:MULTISPECIES: site-2 protease family protein [Leeia]|uniref:Site-2 protease family protein n=1 Tax=Leeia aquatica TaxID=2725557 RepID=A0A847RRR2_9NEIS|nr:site-2 protease family protein [Leeia aquatica]NLR73910.1 site-2 protease family protein [Leeia aquatica]
MDFQFKDILLYAVPILLAITLHEAAHAYAALRLGDKTAWMLGRVSMNPIKHIDPIGTILLPILCLIAGGFLFGWAKPVPVNANNLRNPKRDMFWVSLAGPGINIIMAVFWGLVLKYLAPDMGDLAQPMHQMAWMGLSINAMLAALNLLPIPPLDGGRMLISLLPRPWDQMLEKVVPYGMFIVIGLILTKTLNIALAPMLYVIDLILSVL